MKKIITILFLLLISFNCLAQDLDRGLLPQMRRSLNNNRPYAHTIIDDVTKSAPTKKIERFELRAGDCSKDPTWDDCKTDRERTELVQRVLSEINNKTRWYGWSFYFPKNHKDVWPVKLTISQFLDEGYDLPAWVFHVNNKGIVIENTLTRPGLTQLLIKKEDMLEKWHNIQIETFFSKKEDGKFNIWVNGKEVFKYSGATLKSDVYFFKYGLYRAFLSRAKKRKRIPTQYIYFSNLRLEDTQEALAPKP